MFTGVALRTLVKCSAAALRGSGGALSKLAGGACCGLPSRSWTCTSALNAALGNNCVAGGVAFQPAVRHYARGTSRKKPVIESQLSDLPPTMLKMDYAAVPLAQTTDDIVRRLLSLEFANHRDRLQLKKEQLIAKVQRDETDRSSVEVKVAILTARIRNYQEHLQKHHKDKANKRRMLMAIDRRKKLLKNLRLVNYDTFERLCQQLDITYTFPPEYYRRLTRRWVAKKALCIKVFKEVQKQKAELKMKMKQAQAGTTAGTAKTDTKAQ
ncbi:28S ribosomal protein S15, mitochondrial [Lampris incognitus]|uniref:28S ribosomal protein S15, mitochondrial n=1 Tax=Lampris incognitus TaxID=2546036 RepID=UPI0024B5B040|nr:28S ribosomal protein S15, mitochondrial [Lampris incognitus]